jgi:hypothetical protein
MKELGEILRFVGMISCCVFIFDPNQSYWVHGFALSGIVSFLALKASS